MRESTSCFFDEQRWKRNWPVPFTTLSVSTCPFNSLLLGIFNGDPKTSRLSKSLAGLFFPEVHLRIVLFPSSLSHLFMRFLLTVSLSKACVCVQFCTLRKGHGGTTRKPSPHSLTFPEVRSPSMAAQVVLSVNVLFTWQSASERNFSFFPLANFVNVRLRLSGVNFLCLSSTADLFRIALLFWWVVSVHSLSLRPFSLRSLSLPNGSGYTSPALVRFSSLGLSI